MKSEQCFAGLVGGLGYCTLFTADREICKVTHKCYVLRSTTITLCCAKFASSAQASIFFFIYSVHNLALFCHIGGTCDVFAFAAAQSNRHAAEALRVAHCGRMNTA